MKGNFSDINKIPEFLKNSELLGLIPESRKVFEYALNRSVPEVEEDIPELEEEEEELNAHESNAAAKPYLMHLIVQNEYLSGRTILEIHDFLKRDFVCSRILRGTELIIPKSSTTEFFGQLRILLRIGIEIDVQRLTQRLSSPS